LRGQYRNCAALAARRAPVSRFIPAQRIPRGDTLQLNLRAIIQTGMRRAMLLAPDLVIAWPNAGSART